MKRYITDILIVAIFFLLILLLAGCSKTQPVSDTIADNAITATTALEQQLPAECKTSGITTQFEVIKTEIRAAKNACQAEKDIITHDKLKWKYGFWALVAIIGIYIARKVMK